MLLKVVQVRRLNVIMMRYIEQVGRLIPFEGC